MFEEIRLKISLIQMVRSDRTTRYTRYRFASRKIVKMLSQGARRLAKVGLGTTHPREN